jgi:urease accessory protein
MDTQLDGHLQLAFANDQGTTRLVERRHFGCLRVQKPLYPEGPSPCHVIVVHPPGGVVGGDRLALHANVGTASHAVLCTPGAAKWYKSRGNTSQQNVQLTVAEGACLEWLPQETIFFNAAQVNLCHNVNLAHNAVYMGCEILCFGRTASGETFSKGKITQRTRIRHGGQLIWHEQGSLLAGSPMMHNPSGLAGYTVCATFIAVGKTLSQASVNRLREAMPKSMAKSSLCQFGISQSKTVLVARYLGNASEQARQMMLGVWQHVRPELIHRAAVVPRIWQT